MISRGEQSRRYAALRESMRDASYGALVVAGNTEYNQRGYVRYLSDWRLFGGTAYIVFPLTHAPVFFLGLGAQAEWARVLSTIPDTRAVMDKIDGVASSLKAMGLLKGNIGVVGLNGIMPYGDGKRLLTLLPGACLEDATRLMQDVMAVLSQEEITLAEETHHFVAQVMQRIKEVLAPGKTEREVMAEAIHVAAELGCLDGMAHLTHKAASGTRPPTDRQIEPDDLIKIFLEFAGPSGFLVELGGVFSFREPPEEKRLKFLTVHKAIDRAAELMRPGVKAGELCQVIEDTYRQDGWNITGRRLWDFHGQGLNSLMPPLGMPGSAEELKENMMLNIHPGILTEDGWGVSVTHNYIVTPEGGRPLGDYEREWQVLPF
jgi:Xaa-Pro aminopeptidase